MVDVVNYYLLNRRLRGKVQPIGGQFLVDNFRVNIQPDEEQRLETEGVEQYHVHISEGEVEMIEIPSNVTRPIIEQLRLQVEEFTGEIEAINSLIEDDERSVSEQNATIERLESEKKTEEDEERLDVIASEIEEAVNKKLTHEQNLTLARAALSEKSGLLLNVSENLATELDKGELEQSTRQERVNKQFPFETFVS